MSLIGSAMHFNFFNKTSKKLQLPNSQKGFGLVELMVSITIMTMVSAVVLVKNRTFNNALLLRSQAYEVAFALRQVQLMAVSGTKESSSAANQYGIFFDLNDATTNSKYKVFRDDSQNGNKKGRFEDEDVQLGQLGSLDSHFVIRDIVGPDKVTSLITASNKELSVTFIRPNFDALFKIKTGSSYISGPVYINISTKESPTPIRQVEITNTGQITVI